MKNFVLILMIFSGVAQAASSATGAGASLDRSPSDGTVPAQPGELVIFVNPSLHEIDWHSPARMARSMLHSDRLAKRSDKKKNPNRITTSMGHTVVHFRCRDEIGVEHNVWTGMTGQNDAEETQFDLFKLKVGLGAVLKSYADGSIDPDDKSRRQVSSYHGRIERDAWGRRSRIMPLFLRFAINEKQCRDVADFYRAFKDLSWDKKTPLEIVRKRPASKILHFGLGLDPYSSYKKRLKNPQAPLGGGCSSFGVAFLKIIGRFDPIFEKQWTREMTLSERLIGGPYSRIDSSRKVPMADILLSPKGSSWTHRGWPHSSLKFYDVEKIWDFVDGARNCVAMLEGHLPQNRLPKNCNAEILAWVKKKGGRIKAQYRFEAERYREIRQPGHQESAWEATPSPMVRDGLNLR